MKLTRIGRVAVAAALTTIAIGVPASTAGAATAAAVDGSPATVTGPTFVTSAPATFINTNTQVSEGASSAGGQVAGGQG
jgi:hypothetical protein